MVISTTSSCWIIPVVTRLLLTLTPDLGLTNIILNGKETRLDNVRYYSII
jgi:hypothetical protein